MPSVSVVMPAYNSEKTIAAAVSSVLAQTREDYELLIIDDCSVDGTYAACQALAASDGRIRLLRNETNKGVAYTRNRGVEEATGQWIAFLDSDDMWQAEKLERQMRFIEESDAAISYTATAYIDKDGRAFPYILHAEAKLTFKALLCRNLMSCSSVIVRRDLIRQSAFIDGPLHEDYVSWLKILRETGAAYGLDEPLLVYRLSGESRSGNRVRSGLMAYRAYRAVGYGRILSTLFTVRYAHFSIKKRVQLHMQGKGRS